MKAATRAAGLKESGPLISIRRISLGGGFRYLMESVAVGDGAAERSSPLERYYAESGTPPGRFLGRGLADLDGGRGVAIGTQVSEEHLRFMLVALADPVSGEPVGSSPKAPAGATPVAGFDLTFSPSKSVSVAWALADSETKAVIYDCHLEAIDYVLSYAERDVFCSRSGPGGIVDEDVTGVVAAAFTHFSSRSDDPQLHDHVVVWNRAKSVTDGKWRTLDSRALFKQVTTLSELHQGVLSDLLTKRLGVGWEARRRRHSKKPRYEIEGVPEALMAEFSCRSEQIAEQTKQLREEFVAVHRRSATRVEDMRLHQVATIATRPEKSHASLVELTREWRRRAASHVAEEEQLAFVACLRNRNDLPLLSSGDLGEPILADAAEAVVSSVAERHSTFSRHNLLAEAHRILHGVRFASPKDRVAVAEQVTDLAVDRSLRLTPPELHHVPERLRRPDGSSRFHPRSHVVYTTTALLKAEARLLDAARQMNGPRVAKDIVAAVAETDLAGRYHGLSTDQALAVEQIVTSGRVADVLVGPAGTGKTTTMAGLRAVWEEAYGAGSVVGLAPSAAAAEALSDELGIETENTAKWLTEWRRIPDLVARQNRLATSLARLAHPSPRGAARLRWELKATEEAIAKRRLRPGQLVILDEASMAGTLVLDELVTAARDAGAKVLLVGDWAQLSSIEAGGSFSLLARDRADRVPELSDVRRFENDWEREASVGLRLGRQEALDAYLANERIVEGDRGPLLDVVYGAWKEDIEAGRSSLMIASDAATVSELNRRARGDRVAAGVVSEVGVRIAGGQSAGISDEVVTRQNERRLTAGTSFVKNGDRWVVTAAHVDGRISVRRMSGRGEATLPAAYVAEHVELAYATTAFRAQGQTVDTAHAMVSPTTTREVLYVAATRGRENNRLYVDVSFDPDPSTGHDGALAPRTAREVLAAVLANEGSELSAHETIERAQQRTEDLGVLVAEYETLAAVAEKDRWDSLLGASGLGPARTAAVRTSSAFGPLIASLRRADACGLDIEGTFPRIVASHPLFDADDVAAVLHSRVESWTRAAASKRGTSANFVAGLIPRATRVTDPDFAQALVERDQAIQRRARELAERAVARGDAWVRELGRPPGEPAARERWLAAVSTVAAYRERWDIAEHRSPLGPPKAPKTIEALRHHERVTVAVSRARRLAGERGPTTDRQISTAEPSPTSGPDL
jgi:conjugative relaxase-like TrwC/TraI family protein